MRLSKFVIENMHGRSTVTLTFDDNRLVLVGENGSGKSTALTVLYYFMTKQWHLLEKMPFSRIRAYIDAEEFELTAEHLKEVDYAAAHNYLLKRIGSTSLRTLRNQFAHHGTANLRDGKLQEMARAIGVSNSVLWEFLRSYDVSSDERAPTQTIERYLDKNLNSQVLFLPTYRRIEKDLQQIFPEAKMERDVKVFNRENEKDGTYVELVEFGMKDVDAWFRQTMVALDKEFRADLNKLTAEYLEHVIHDDHAKITVDGLQSPSVIEAAINRMDDTILSPKTRKDLLTLVRSVQAQGAIPQHRRVAAHFLWMLVRTHERQLAREEKVRRLVDVCNAYLTGKEMIFDPQQFELRIQLSEGQVPIQPKDLSSGEKQIVSLFTHLYLSGKAGYFVLIDEPELSISVDWQRRFLLDIIDTGLCSGLVAVTHSPFVIDNEMKRYAHAMAEFMQ